MGDIRDAMSLGRKANALEEALLCDIDQLLSFGTDGAAGEGKKKIGRITRYTTVGLGLLLGWAYYTMLNNYASSGLEIITK